MLKQIHLSKLFFAIAAMGIGLIAAGHFVSVLAVIGKASLLVLLFATILDVLLVCMVKQPIRIQRNMLTRMNLGDENPVELLVSNEANQPLHVKIYEGFPVFMQKRSEEWNVILKPRSVRTFHYVILPTERGEFRFEPLVIFIRSLLFLAERRIELAVEDRVQVYPSVLQMKRFELKVFNQQTLSQGIKKIRRIGNTNEFEQITNYTQGDDLRTINWKATSRRHELMVNQYQEERSQPVYCVIDKSRSMQLSFKGMTMLDYAINSTLVFSNIALRKGDRAGLITFSDKIGVTIPAEKSQGHLKRILENLYNQKTRFKEANFELLFQTIRHRVKTRSLLILFTNFESEFAMHRALPMLQQLNKRHVLVVVFFQNNELSEVAQQPITSAKELIEATVADKLANIKWSIAHELRQNGIYTILTKPEDLSISTINMYLELKAKGLI